ncbi:MAG TPA: hypothetical protein VEI83_02955 [Acidimicrobiales bacterium]|nr:hypothetical protein [Acidimicrobiales bacterium]
MFVALGGALQQGRLPLDQIGENRSTSLVHHALAFPQSALQLWVLTFGRTTPLLSRYLKLCGCWGGFDWVDVRDVVLGLVAVGRAGPDLKIGSKAAAELSHHPRPLEDSVRDTVHWLEGEVHL